MKKLLILLPCLLGILLSGCAVVAYDPGVGPYYSAYQPGYDGAPYYVYGDVPYYYSGGRYFYYRNHHRYYVTHLPHGGYYSHHNTSYSSHNYSVHQYSGHTQQLSHQYHKTQPHMQYGNHVQQHSNVVQGQKLQHAKPVTGNQVKGQSGKYDKMDKKYQY